MAELDRDEIAKRFGLPRYMTLDELCIYANCSERHIHDEIKKRNLKSYKPVRCLEFDPGDVQVWIKRRVVNT